MGILRQKFWTSSSSRPSSLSSIFIPAGIHEDHSTPHVFPFNSTGVSTRYSLQRFKSTQASNQLEQLYSTDDDDHDHSQALDFPGGKVTYIPEMRFLSESSGKRIPCYRLSEEVSVKIYSIMVSLQMMDTVFYEAQRQGRISFYLTSAGEEAINIASAAALSADDIILPQYREPGNSIMAGLHNSRIRQPMLWKQG
ncbi:hypothetical protein OIU78_022086 [Salix suchowensis]|nr:hypothetical protein OIU78_022086 [Salix suchowensis]